MVVIFLNLEPNLDCLSNVPLTAIALCCVNVSIATVLQCVNHSIMTVASIM